MPALQEGVKSGLGETIFIDTKSSFAQAGLRSLCFMRKSVSQVPGKFLAG